MLKRLLSVYVLVVLLVLAVVSAGCTANARARQFGGNITIELPVGEELVTATWKEAHLWYLTRSRPANQPPRTLKFTESSQYGLLQGTVTFVER